MNQQNLHNIASILVNQYGPRHALYFSPFIDDNCTVDTSVIYPKSNLEMASDYAKSLYESWGYQVTMEQVDLGGTGGNGCDSADYSNLHGTGGVGHNVVATKIGSIYPNVFIEVGGHLDTQPTTPGAGDNASGSAAILELARVLKDYPSRYSIRFINFVGHEQTAFNIGSNLHLNQALARGETIKTGLIMDGIGWSEVLGQNMNVLWYNNSESERISSLFNTVSGQYGIDINWRETTGCYSDNQSYWNLGLTAVLSIGGTPYLAPGYHGTSNDGGCGDTLDKLDWNNMFKTAQQNLAVLLQIDAENQLPVPPPSLPVVAAIASSAYGSSDTDPYWPIKAFDGNAATYWKIGQDNFGYPDRWLQADLGDSKAINEIYLNFGIDQNAVATSFQVLIGDDPTFAPGRYTVAATVTNNSQAEVNLPVSPVINGRWVRLLISAVAGSYQVADMRIYGSDLPSNEVKYAVTSATASSSNDLPRTAPINVFDGQYNDYWHVNSTDTFPKWIQADLGGENLISRVATFNYGGYALMADENKAVDFQIWVGNDPNFADGSYTIAASVTGNNSWITKESFAPVSCRYLRYVVTAVKGTDPSHYWNTNLYELEIWGP